MSPRDDSPPPEPVPRPALWPSRLSELGRILRERPDDERARGDFWLILNSSLQQRIRRESVRTGPIDEEELRDLASEKSLDLMNQFDGGNWRPETSTRAQVASFVTTVARNGLIDLLRRLDRRPVDPNVDLEGFALAGATDGSRSEPPDAAVERGEVVGALVQCAESMNAMHRTAWIFRVFLDMPSHAIAHHPRVQRKPGHVDVILQRCRAAMNDCMKRKGHDVTRMPTGSFAALWRAFQLDEIYNRDAGNHA